MQEPITVDPIEVDAGDEASALSDNEQIVRNDLIVQYLHLVDIVVRRLPYDIVRYWGVDDLRGFGRLGLIDAVRRRQGSSEDVPFATYALVRIRGSIFDELRRLDWLPRTLRRRVIEYRETEDSLRSARGRNPTRKEVIGEMGLDGAHQASTVTEAVRRQQIDYLQDPYSDNDEGSRGDYLVAPDDPEEAVLTEIGNEELRRAINHLSTRQRAIIAYRFDTQLTQQKVGEMLGVSNTRICQLEGQALRELREVLSVDHAA